jgi:hexokinase
MQNFRYRPEILEGVAEQLTGALKEYEDMFIVDGAKLKIITDHIVKELEKGLSVEGGTIVSIIGN